MRFCVSARSSEVEQCEIDYAVAHVDGGANLQVLASDALEIENGLIEFGSLVEIVHADREVTQTGHQEFSSLLPLLANIGRSRPEGIMFPFTVE
jgi:hypothetical protein